MNVKFLFTLGFLVLCTPAYANIFQDCKLAVGTGDLEKATEYMNTIARFNTPPSPTDQVLGAECFSFATGEPHVYSASQGAFVSESAETLGLLEKQQQQALEEAAAKAKAEENAKLAAEAAERQARAEAQAALAEIERQERISEVWRAVAKACVSLYKDDEVAALTNDTCREVFFEIGLPED